MLDGSVCFFPLSFQRTRGHTTAGQPQMQGLDRESDRPANSDMGYLAFSDAAVDGRARHAKDASRLFDGVGGWG